MHIAYPNIEKAMLRERQDVRVILKFNLKIQVWENNIGSLFSYVLHTCSFETWYVCWISAFFASTCKI